MSKFVEDNEIRIPIDLYNKFGVSTLFPKDFISFEEARDFIIKLKLKNSREWREYSKSGKRPDSIPSAPNAVYKDKGWISWGDFFGTGYLHTKEFLPFKAVKDFVIKLKLKGYKEWEQYCKSGKKPNNIPSTPHRNYKDKWKGYGDFLGTGNVRKSAKDFVSFKEAREFLRKLKFKNVREWVKYCKSDKKPNNIPSNLDKIYKNNGWIDWGDFLGTRNFSSKNRIYLSFEEAREFARELKLKNMREWKEYLKSSKRPKNIHSTPENIYKDKWNGYGDFLGTGNVRYLDFLSFEEAREFTRSLKLESKKEWREYCRSGKRPNNIPSSPYTTYKDKGWKGIKDFLGTNKKDFLSFKEARKFAKKLKLKSKIEWCSYCKSGKKPNNIPSDPYTVYKNKGWTNWYDFLGKNK